VYRGYSNLLCVAPFFPDSAHNKALAPKRRRDGRNGNGQVLNALNVAILRLSLGAGPKFTYNLSNPTTDSVRHRHVPLATQGARYRQNIKDAPKSPESRRDARKRESLSAT
jgi:hypothetical protein